MIYYDIHYPVTMTGPMLDAYLAKGWYRMQQTIFTTDVIIKNDMVIPVFWLRLVLSKYKQNKTAQKIITTNKKFSIACGNGYITDEAEELYQLYCQSISFDVSPTIQDSLIGEGLHSVYNTKAYSIRDGKKLIGLGYFDDGENSIAGILNIYHPDYKQYSLGKYLMLLKIEYALQQHKEFYYPGYISTGISKFDYKLFVGKEASEVYIRKTDQWMPWLSITEQQLEEWLFAEE
jgi:leucyl-tRNA---protein transferase